MEGDVEVRANGFGGYQGGILKTRLLTYQCGVLPHRSVFLSLAAGRYQTRVFSLNIRGIDASQPMISLEQCWGYIRENTIPTPPPSAELAPVNVADSCHPISQRPTLLHQYCSDLAFPWRK